MRFKEWFLEMSGIKDMDTTNVALSPIASRFDLYTAQDRCTARMKEQDFYKGIRDSYEDDEEFMKQLEDWRAAHPEPDYYSGTGEYRAWEEEYHKLIKAWETANRERRSAVQPQIDEFMKDCVQQAEAEYRAKMPNKGYKYNFNIDGKNYIATFYRMDERQQRNDGSFSKIIPYIGTIPNVFTIEFEGPDGYSLTRREGGGATKIYTQLLLGAKKLMESENVNAMYFSPADSAMALMYKKFYDQFLSKDFIQPGKNMYIRKSYLKEKLKNVPDDKKQYIYSMILSGNRDIRQGLKDISQRKISERNMLMSAKQNIGKIVGYKYSYGNVIPVYVLGASAGYDGPQVQVWALSGDDVMKVRWGLTPDNRNEISRLTDTSSISPEIMEKFKNALKERVGI